MGHIISSRRAEKDNIIIELLVSQKEMRQLKGEMNDIYLVSERVADVPSRVSLRGRNEATKYFLIPKQLRKQLAIRGKVSCQRLEREGKSIFVYFLDPIGVNKSFIQSEA